MNWMSITLVIIVGIVFVVAIILVKIDEVQTKRNNKAYLEALNKLRDEYSRSIKLSAEWEKIRDRVN